VDWLAWAEYCYNTSYHTALRATSFEVVYGRPPPALLPHTAGAAQTDAADTLLRERDSFLDDIRAATSTDEEAARLLDGGLDAPWHTDAGLLHGKRIFVRASSMAPGRSS